MRNRRYEPGCAEMKFLGYGHCSDHVDETIWVATVTETKSPPDQLEDLLRRLLTNVATPVPVPAPVQVVPTVPIRVAVVTTPKPPPDQLEDLLRRLLANAAAPVPVPAPVREVPMEEKLLQCLVAEIQSRQPVAATKPKPPVDQLEDYPGSGPSSGSGGPTVNNVRQHLVA